MAGIREERTRQIIEAAMSVFGKKGYHRAKMGEVAKEAGIGKSTVYEYFDSKKCLFEEMLRSIAQDYMMDVQEALKTGKGCRERLIAFGRNHGCFIKSHMELAESTMSESNSVSEDLKKEMIRWKMEVFKMVEDILRSGVDSGELNENLDTKTSTAIILGAINENYAIQMIVDGKKPEEVELEKVIDLILGGLK